MASISETFKKISSMFSFGHKGAILGVDVGSAFIKVALIEKKEERVILRNYGEIALGPRAGLPVGQATNLPQEKIIEALKELLDDAGITAQHIFLAIPFSASFLKIVEFPNLEEKALASMIPIEARKYIPVPMTEVSLDWWILPNAKKEKTEGAPVVPSPVAVPEKTKVVGKIDVILAAIHNDVLKKYETIEKGAQVSGGASHFEIEIFSTLRSVVGRDLSSTLVIDLGASSTKMVIIDGGVVHGSHTVSSGGQDITLALSKAQGVTFEKAEEIKCRVGILGDEEGRDVLASADLILSNISNEASRFAKNYEQKYETKITKIILTGGGANLLGIDKKIEKNFSQVSITTGDPFARVDTPVFLGPTLKKINPKFAVALGIALRGLEE